ncbi:hypothetical protein [Ulvibacterium marinum]|uniref:Uncharacterized protein n=1 Tax=Ulvibacterium marinum TaxID=2419782 RepID=A0A3B0BY39_9FLAO|nr:hypothetical protein [Ulvibacterium marinum]RKN78525.1 hypothetical protein D7Z94_20135 [Ulvibacterium marinum]
MTKEKPLFRTIFLASVILLLINDLYLKYEYHNFFTGKLSDFAGLFAFPYFFSCFFSKRIKSIYIFSGILFIIWKSEYSQPFFDFAHSYGIGIDRTVDYTDLVSLLILPISYAYWNSEFRQLIQPKKILKPFIIGICCFAFIATSVPNKEGALNLKSNYRVELKSDLKKARAAGLIYYSLENDKYISMLRIPEKNAEIELSLMVKEKEKGILSIKLDSILNYYVEGSTFIFSGGVDEDDVNFVKQMTLEDFEKLFVEQKIKPLMEK